MRIFLQNPWKLAQAFLCEVALKMFWANTASFFLFFFYLLWMYLPIHTLHTFLDFQCTLYRVSRIIFCKMKWISLFYFTHPLRKDMRCLRSALKLKYVLVDTLYYEFFSCIERKKLNWCLLLCNRNGTKVDRPAKVNKLNLERKALFGSIG